MAMCTVLIHLFGDVPSNVVMGATREAFGGKEDPRAWRMMFYSGNSSCLASDPLLPAFILCCLPALPLLATSPRSSAIVFSPAISVASICNTPLCAATTFLLSVLQYFCPASNCKPDSQLVSPSFPQLLLRILMLLAGPNNNHCR